MFGTNIFVFITVVSVQTKKLFWIYEGQLKSLGLTKILSWNVIK